MTSDASGTAQPGAAGRTSLEHAFGSPVVSAERTIIPLASVLSSPGGNGQADRVWRTRHVGVIELNADGVHIHFAPSVLRRLLVIVALLTAWNAFWLIVIARKLAQDKPAPPPVRTSQ